MRLHALQWNLVLGDNFKTILFTALAVTMVTGTELKNPYQQINTVAYKVYKA